jgi:hypothetical protein
MGYPTCVQVAGVDRRGAAVEKADANLSKPKLLGYQLLRSRAGESRADLEDLADGASRRFAALSCKERLHELEDTAARLSPRQSQGGLDARRA